MPTAMEGCYARYGHIVNPSLWSRLLDLCLGSELADRLHIARLERAHRKSVAALLERGEEVYPLPEEFRKDNSTARTAPAADAEATEDRPNSKGGEQEEQREDGEQTEQAEQPYFEPFFCDHQFRSELPPIDEVVTDSLLPDGAHGAPQEEPDYSTWSTFEWSRRRRPDPNRYRKIVVNKGAFVGYGFRSDRDPNVSNLSRMLLAPEEYMSKRFQRHIAWGPVTVCTPPTGEDDAFWGEDQDDSGCVIETESEDNGDVAEEFL